MTNPRPSTYTRGSQSAGAGHHIGNDVWQITGDGAPSDGTSGTGAGYAGPASTYHDYTNGKVYVNTNTKASPTWVVVGNAT